MLYDKVVDKYRFIFYNSQMHEFIMEIVRHKANIDTYNSDNGTYDRTQLLRILQQKSKINEINGLSIKFMKHLH